MIDIITWQNIQKHCIQPYEANPYNPLSKLGFQPYNDHKCNSASNTLDNMINQLNYDPYGLDYLVCTETEQQRERQYYKLHSSELLSQTQQQRDDLAIEQIRGSTSSNDYQNACESTYTSEYLNQQSVINAIHVNLNYLGKLDKQWSGCSNTVGTGFSSAHSNDFNRYVELVLQWLFDTAPHMDITIFSGDDDTVCSTLGTQQWLNNFKLFGGSTDLHIISPWRSWSLTETDDQTGGSVINFDKINLVTGM